MPSDLLDLKALVRDVPDFPKAGIVFKDLTPVWKDPAAFRAMVERLASSYRSRRVGTVAGTFNLKAYEFKDVPDSKVDKKMVEKMHAVTDSFGSEKKKKKTKKSEST